VLLPVLLLPLLPVLLLPLPLHLPPHKQQTGTSHHSMFKLE
jgi:hypothetical protein